MKIKKGFTLVELLIVIVVIGILSAMMMLSSTEAVSSAKVARIISDLTNWKKAVLAWYEKILELKYTNYLQLFKLSYKNYLQANNTYISKTR